MPRKGPVCPASATIYFRMKLGKQNAGPDEAGVLVA
jgi:hypothetical protein